MPEITDVINSFNELTQHLIPKAYLPTIYELAFKRKRSWLADRVPRSSENVEGLKVYLTFLTRLPWAWRSMSEFGYTPTGAKFDSNEQYAQLSCSAASAIVSLTELEATAQGRWKDIVAKQMSALSRTFPYYVRALLWTSQNSTKALGKAASIDGTLVTLDNEGLWHTATEDRAKLFEKDMYVQVYRSGVKVGAPVRITGVDRKLGKIQISSDPGVADDDVFVCSDVAGLDQPYSTLMPGILDVIDDDNTFQGINRDTTGNEDFRAVLKDATGLALDHELLTNFFHDVYDPETAFTNWKIVRKYWQDNLASNVRYTPGGKFVDGVDGVRVGRTNLMMDDDVDEDKIIVPDFANMRIADRGGVENLFNKGWQQIPGRPFIEYVVVWWALLLAEDCRYMGLMHDISLAA
jgi:hypothetical protein